MSKTPTNNQRYWLKHVNTCAKTETTMKACADSHQLDVRRLYSWKELGSIYRYIKTYVVCELTAV